MWCGFVNFIGVHNGAPIIFHFLQHINTKIPHTEYDTRIHNTQNAVVYYKK